MHRRYLAALLVLSGFCGLAYELVWVRMLALSFGSTTLSFSTVIAVFLGGLALGSWLCGRSPRALADPVRTYALLEIATGVIGLALFPVLRALPEAFSYIDPGVGAAGLLARLGVSIVVLLPPTLLMGATLPVACAACIHDDAELGPGTAILYGLNTLGACCGAYGVTFVLLPVIGLAGAVLVVVGLNFAVGAAALFLRHGHVDERESPPSSAAVSVPSDPPSLAATGIVALAFTTGFAAVTAQVVWSRLLSSYLEGTVYGVGAVLVAVLVGIGLGSLLITRRVTSSRDAAQALTFVQGVLLASMLVLWVTLPQVQYLIQTLRFGLVGLPLIHAQLAVTVAALIVPSAASGAILPILVRLLENRATHVPASLGRLYAVNTAGSVGGSLLAGFVLLPTLGITGTAYLATVVITGNLVFSALRLLRSPSVVRYALGLASAVAISLFPDIDPIRPTFPVERGETYWSHSHRVQQMRSQVTYFEEGTVGTVAVFEDDGVRSLLLNGLGQGNYSAIPPHHAFESLLVALIPLVHAPAPTGALVVGLGAGTTIDAMLQLGVPAVQVVELEPAVVRAQRAIFGTRAPTDDPRVEVIIDDARHHLLLNARTPRRFDVITSMPAHPWVAASVFTREFFAIARSNLSPTGVFSMWFGRAHLDDAMFRALLSGFASVFPHYVVYDVPEVDALYFVGSNAALALQPDRFEMLAAQPSLRSQRWPAWQPTFLLERTLAVGIGSTEPDDSPINSDANMFVEVRGPLVGSSTRSMAGLVPRPGVDPLLIPPPQRQGLVIQLLESMLGTPDGRVPSIASLQPRPGAAALLARAELPSLTTAYFQARLELARNPSATAIAALDAVAGPGELGRRAASFAAAFEVDPERRATRQRVLIESGRARSDLWLRALDEPTREAAIAAAASSTVAPAIDPLGWLIAVAHGARLHDEASDVYAPLGALLATPQSPLVYDLCTRAADAVDLPVLRQRCEQASLAGRARESSALVGQARRAADAQRDDVVVHALSRAQTLHSLDARALELYLAAAARSRDPRRLEEIVRVLQLRNVPDALITAQIAKARDERSAPVHDK